MAANKFATLLHRRTNKLTLVLVYAFLEWVLIFLLLLNSIFSYFIIKFADYFGLQKPCLWCCRLDHVFEPSKFHNSYRSLICEAHSLEISKLGYCSNHRKLAESRDMCVDCKFSAPEEKSNKFVFFPMMNKLGVNSELISKCSCCGVSLEKTTFSPNGFLTDPFLLKSPKGNVISEGEIEDEEVYFDGKRSDFEYDCIGEKQGKYDEDENRGGKTEEKFSCCVSSLDCSVMEEEEESAIKDNVYLCKDEEERVETRELSREIEMQHLEFYIDEDACHLIPIENDESMKKLGRNEMEDEDFVMEFDKHEAALKDRSNFKGKLPLLPILECEEEALIAELEAFDLNEIDHFEENLSDFEIEQFPIGYLQAVQGEMESHIYQGSKWDEAQSRSLAVDTSEREMKNRSERNEIREEEMIPDTPTSTDGSITSDIEGVVTVEKLKRALKAERKALNEVYEELEEERSAAAEAANQAMAMINRLQQEKAAIQMEALQYQRIMEQQSEYDHEALQMMTELVAKREKELEFYRKKVQDYETREKLNTPVDLVLHMEDLANLEEERLLILNHLKTLENKLFSLSEAEETQHSYHENGNGHIEKRLLPLFNAVEG